jgi:hypothetical protein
LMHALELPCSYCPISSPSSQAFCSRYRWVSTRLSAAPSAICALPFS